MAFSEDVGGGVWAARLRSVFAERGEARGVGKQCADFPGYVGGLMQSHCHAGFEQPLGVALFLLGIGSTIISGRPLVSASAVVMPPGLLMMR